MIKNEIDALTLQYFVNNKFERSVNPETSCDTITVSSAERRFYKKRIIQLVKDLFKKPAPNDVLQSSFNDFVFASISYFKTTDASEVLQEEYQNINSDKACTSESGVDISQLNEEMFNVTPQESTLDGFVTTKTVKMTEKILPKTKPINITNDKFKMKGVKKKKKKENVERIYGKGDSKEKSQNEVRT